MEGEVAKPSPYRLIRNDRTMNLGQKVNHGIEAVALSTPYFAAWIGVLVVLK